jgi:hypothetical protein
VNLLSGGPNQTLGRALGVVRNMRLAARPLDDDLGTDCFWVIFLT